MDSKKIEHLLEKYWEGDTSLREEKEIKAFFENVDNPPEHLKVYKNQFSFFSTSKQASESQSLDFENKLKQLIDEQDEDKSNSKQVSIKIKYREIRKWSLRIAASILLFISGWYFGRFSQNVEIKNQAANATNVEKLTQDMNEIKQMLIISKLKQSSASERIIGVNYVEGVQNANHEVLDALIETLNNDENTNVRIAAANALFTFRDDTKVRNALISSLQKQNDPVIQITLINIMIALKDKKVKVPIEQFLKKEKMMPKNVKAKIRGELQSL